MRPPFAGHVPGALSIALRGSFASWLGWLAAADRPLVLVLDDGQDRGERVRQALKIGYESLVGELAGGMAAWRASGRAEARTELVRDPVALRGPVLDVRQTGEYVGGHVPGATLLELGSLPAQAADVASGAVTVMCGHGERAATAASLLERAGGRSAVFVGGAGDWSRALARGRQDRSRRTRPARPGHGAQRGGRASGSGGGGGVAVDPIGYLEIGPGGAAFRPIPQLYRSPLFLFASGMTAAIVLRALARLIRG